MHSLRLTRQRRLAKNQLRRRAIPRAIQAVAHRIAQADRHHITQIAVADLRHPLQAHEARQVVILVVDHAENRSEDNYEKIFN